MSKLYGPWESGMAAVVANGRNSHIHPGSAPLKLSAYNVRGACRQPGEGRILQLVSALHADGIHVAVLSEPRLEPGVPWSDWTGYSFVGERTAEAGSVAVLIVDEARESVVPIQGVRDEQAVWLQARTGTSGILVLGVYGHHGNYPEAVQVGFWANRVEEAKVLQADPRFKDRPIVTLGDFNTHFRNLGGDNVTLERPRDRRIAAMLTSIGLQARNLPGVATYQSGSIIDAVMASLTVFTEIDVSGAKEGGAESDHFRVNAKIAADIALDPMLVVGRAIWKIGGDWENALIGVAEALRFIVGWAGIAMRHLDVMSWVVSGTKGKLRQSIIDLAVWRHAVLYTVAGHVRDLVVAKGRRVKRPEMVWSEELHRIQGPARGGEVGVCP